MRLVLLLALALGVFAGAKADIVTKTVDYKDGDVVLEGFLAYDSAGAEKRPVVLVIQDWNGIDDYERMRCRMIASLGYVAFAPDIYGKGVRPKNPQESAAEAGKYYGDNALLRSRLHAALDQARKLPHADPAKIGVIGYCFGGMCALEIARMGADVAGVVSFHGSLTTSAPAKAGAVKAEVLVLHGAADPFVPPADVEAFEKEMKAAGAKFKLVAYPGAVHSFTVKGSESYGMPGVAYDEKADTQSWEEMKTFFARVLGSG